MTGLYHEVQPGETLLDIAVAYGYHSHKPIYSHANNAAFRSKRPNPNLIHPGDMVYIPPREKRDEEAPADASHRYVVKRPKKLLRLAIEDSNGERLKNAPYELIIGPDHYLDNTDGEGMLIRRIPLHARQATLKVHNITWSLEIGHLNPVKDTIDDGVSGIQARLLNLGFDPGPVDGKMGPLTEAAIATFQKKNFPLVVDGICGPKTLARLVELHGS